MLTENISTNFIIFSNEKKFSVDGPTYLCNYQKNDVATLNLPKRQRKNGSIMVHENVCSIRINFYLTKTSSKMNSDEYIKLLDTEIFSLLKNNIKASEREKYWWQQDNASVHTSRKTRDFLMFQPFKSFQWTAG